MPLELTDTFGSRVPRPGLRSVLAVLGAPVNLVGDGPDEYALVHCEAANATLVRWGERDRDAGYTLTTPDQEIRAPHERREILVRLFLAVCRCDTGEQERLQTRLATPCYRQLALW